MTPQQVYAKHRGPSDPPWEALPAIARRGWAVAAAEASKNAPQAAVSPRSTEWRPPTAPSVPDHVRPRHPGAPRA